MTLNLYYQEIKLYPKEMNQDLLKKYLLQEKQV